MIHIVVEKVNKLLVYPHTTFIWSCTKLVKCDYLTQINLFDLVLNTLWTRLEPTKIFKFFISL